MFVIASRGIAYVMSFAFDFFSEIFIILWIATRGENVRIEVSERLCNAFRAFDCAAIYFQLVYGCAFCYPALINQMPEISYVTICGGFKL